MHLYYTLFGLRLPSYGTCIALGLVLGNLLAWLVIRKTKDVFDDFLLMEAYIFLGGFAGAKLLYILVSFRDIDWSRITDMTSFNAFLSQGFVFYGGLIGGLLLAWLSGRFHRFDSPYLIRKYIFLVPFVHAFGRIGCFMAGCCYGVPYDGWCAVTFPEGSLAIPGVSLFPVQLLEAILLFLISGTVMFASLKKKSPYTVELYLLLYGIVRFFLEFLRYDEIRGHVLSLSTSQWIALIMIAAAVISILIRRNRIQAKKS